MMKARDKVLIVDDSDINRSLLADMLAQDYELLEAANGIGSRHDHESAIQ